MAKTQNGLYIPEEIAREIAKNSIPDREVEFVNRIVAILTNETRIADGAQPMQPYALISAVATVIGMQQFRYNLNDDDILMVVRKGMEMGRREIARIATQHIVQTKGMGTPT